MKTTPLEQVVNLLSHPLHGQENRELLSDPEYRNILLRKTQQLIEGLPIIYKLQAEPTPVAVPAIIQGFGGDMRLAIPRNPNGVCAYIEPQEQSNDKSLRDLAITFAAFGALTYAGFHAVDYAKAMQKATQPLIETIGNAMRAKPTPLAELPELPPITYTPKDFPTPSNIASHINQVMHIYRGSLTRTFKQPTIDAYNNIIAKEVSKTLGNSEFTFTPAQRAFYIANMYALRDQESGGNPTIVSRAGAIGVLQVMKDTALRVDFENHPLFNIYKTVDQLKKENPKLYRQCLQEEGEKLLNPQYNIRKGVKTHWLQFSQYYAKTKNVLFAMTFANADYNGGSYAKPYPYTPTPPGNESVHHYTTNIASNTGKYFYAIKTGSLNVESGATTTHSTP